MYGEMPVRAAFPMKEYKEQMTKMMVFFQFGHCIALSTPTQFFFFFFFSICLGHREETASAYLQWIVRIERRHGEQGLSISRIITLLVYEFR